MNFYISSLQYAKDNNCNYAYDQEGRLIQDLQEEIVSIEWRVDGKVKRINRIANSTKQNLSFDYDAMGHRIAKHVYTSANVLEKSTYYVLDATGKQIAVYERNIDENTQSVAFQLTERTIYGTTRLGSLNKTMNLLGSAGTATYVQATVNHSIGKRSYELANHLGSVITVVSDKVLPHPSSTSVGGGSTVDYWLADILQSSDYSPFGVQLSGRNLKLSGNNVPYVYGFNGMIKDDELKGDGNSYDFGARMLDTRLGRWLSIDPKSSKYPSLCPYNFVSNMPISAIDPDGKDIVILTASAGAQGMGHTAMIIQDQSGNWYYFTQGGAGDGGISKMSTSGIDGGIMFQPLGTTDMATAIALARNDKNNSYYDCTLTIKTSKEMDQEIYLKALEVTSLTNSGDKKYNLIFNNCTDACQEVLESEINLPIDLNPKPNSYHAKLTKKLTKIQTKIDNKILKEQKKEQKKLDKENEKKLKALEKEKKNEEKEKARVEKEKKKEETL